MFFIGIRLWTHLVACTKYRPRQILYMIGMCIGYGWMDVCVWGGVFGGSGLRVSRTY